MQKLACQFSKSAYYCWFKIKVRISEISFYVRFHCSTGRNLRTFSWCWKTDFYIGLTCLHLNLVEEERSFMLTVHGLCYLSSQQPTLLKSNQSSKRKGLITCLLRCTIYLKDNNNALWYHWTVNPWFSYLLTGWELHECLWLYDYKETRNCKIFCSSKTLWSREFWFGDTRACFHLAVKKFIFLPLAVERENCSIILKSKICFSILVICRGEDIRKNFTHHHQRGNTTFTIRNYWC